MQHQLNWKNLQQQQKIARLSLLYKALYDHIALQVPPYYTQAILIPEQITSSHSFIPVSEQMSTCTVSTLKLYQTLQLE